jgi:hypothetical protein
LPGRHGLSLKDGKFEKPNDKATKKNCPSAAGAATLISVGSQARAPASARNGRVRRTLQPLPNIDERLGERIDQPIIVIRTRRDAQPFRAFRHRRIVDRLDVDAVVCSTPLVSVFPKKEEIGGRLDER